MCFGVPAKVISVGEKLTVLIKGSEREVIAMCEAKVGDTVLISQGVATSTVTPKEAEELEKMLNAGD